MSVKDANIWKFGFFKNVSTLFKSSPRSQACLFISETGIISLINLPMATGWMSDVANKVSWMVDHRCLQRLEGHDSLVMPVSERSFKPLDPMGAIKDEADVSLNNIAWSKRREAFSRVMDENKTGGAQKLMQTMVLAFLLITGVVLLIFFMKHK
jgi:hypothetical protein